MKETPQNDVKETPQTTTNYQYSCSYSKATHFVKYYSRPHIVYQPKGLDLAINMFHDHRMCSVTPIGAARVGTFVRAEAADDHSISSLTTVPVTNKNKVSPETQAKMSKSQHSEEGTLDSDEVGTFSRSKNSHVPPGDVKLFGGGDISSLSGSSEPEEEVLDADLQAEVDAIMAEAEAVKAKAKKEQRKRQWQKNLKLKEHDDATKKNQNPKGGDDEDMGGNDGQGESNPPAVAAA